MSQLLMFKLTVFIDQLMHLKRYTKFFKFHLPFTGKWFDFGPENGIWGKPQAGNKKRVLTPPPSGPYNYEWMDG